MTKKWFAAALIALFACGLSSTAFADVITLATPGIIGAADGLSGDNTDTDAPWIAQDILDLTMGDSFDSGGRTWRASTVAEYDGIIDVTSADKTDLPEQDQIPAGMRTVPAGYVYALGKYDGKNAGWILFHLPTYGNTLPEFSYSIWGTNDEQFQISNYTVFNSAGVPDGGSTLALLGSILVGFGILRRRTSR
jgi:hypothetical protein